MVGATTGGYPPAPSSDCPPFVSGTACLGAWPGAGDLERQRVDIVPPDRDLAVKHRLIVCTASESLASGRNLIRMAGCAKTDFAVPWLAHVARLSC